MVYNGIHLAPYLGTVDAGSVKVCGCLSPSSLLCSLFPSLWSRASPGRGCVVGCDHDWCCDDDWWMGSVVSWAAAQRQDTTHCHSTQGTMQSTSPTNTTRKTCHRTHTAPRLTSSRNTAHDTTEKKSLTINTHTQARYNIGPMDPLVLFVGYHSPYCPMRPPCTDPPPKLPLRASSMLAPMQAPHISLCIRCDQPMTKARCPSCRRLATQKGPDLLVEAIPLVPLSLYHMLRLCYAVSGADLGNVGGQVLSSRHDVKFAVVGDGYMRADLERR
eukprot:1234887-Rhodomonas_salina.1